MSRFKTLHITIWARRHVLALSLADNILTALAVALLGFLLGLVIGIVLTAATYEIEHYRRTRQLEYALAEVEYDEFTAARSRAEAELAAALRRNPNYTRTC